MRLPLLHGSTDGSLLAAWTLDPLLVNLLALTAICYGIGLRSIHRKGRPVSGWRAASFFGGLAVVAFSLIGPLETWNDDLFFIHMLQHLALMIVAAPLLLLGRPVQIALQALPSGYSRAIVGSVFRRSRARRVATVLTHPLTVFLAFNLNLALWHLPGMYVRALENDLVHEIEHFAFFGTSLLFWWVIVDPVPRHHRAPAHWLFGMCFGTCMIGGLVAAALTVANRVLYPYYLSADQPWGLTPLADQKLGGGIMWISGAVYFALMFAMLYQMVKPDDGEPQRRAAAQVATPRTDRSPV
ncbi:MAG: cytochrome c oxidase assembly protein [Thermomicrobiales bacterium]